MRCAIVPPHVLERISQGSASPELRDLAAATLAIDREQRFSRLTATIPPGAELTPVAGPATPRRSVSTARNQRFIPGDLVRNEGDGPVADDGVDSCYDWLGVTFELFWKVYGRNSIDGAGLPMESTVHYGRNYGNAFWNGDRMVYGDGDGELFLAFTDPIDVTAHELTHGVTQYTTNLEYEGQSGALNESISDVFGSLAKQYHLRQEAGEADWLIGAGLLGPAVDRAVALRSMREPGTAYDDDVLGRDPQPGHMRDYVETHDDNGGVHINSGIPNKAFYLAATALGGYAWEIAGRVWYETITGGRIDRKADFATFAAATEDAAARRYGRRSSVTEAVGSAWEEVGVRR